MSAETSQQLTEIILAPVLARAVCTVAKLGIADLIPEGSDKPVSELAAGSRL